MCRIHPQHAVYFWKSEVPFQMSCGENLFAKVGDALLMNIFTAFATLDVNLMNLIGFDNKDDNE